MREPVKDGYFTSLQQGMVTCGFALMTRVQIDNTERPYHVPADFARTTNLFFHLPQRSIMLHMEFMEHNC